MATSVQLPQLPFRHTHPLETAPALRQLRSLGTVHRVRTPVGHEAWLITGYAQVRELLDDPRLGRSHPRPETAARSGESALFGGPLGDFDTETADHTRMPPCCSRTSPPGTCAAWHPGWRR